jgi:hypothetical protein
MRVRFLLHNTTTLSVVWWDNLPLFCTCARTPVHFRFVYSVPTQFVWTAGYNWNAAWKVLHCRTGLGAAKIKVNEICIGRKGHLELLGGSLFSPRNLTAIIGWKVWGGAVLRETRRSRFRCHRVPGIGKLVTADLWFFCSCPTIVNQMLHDNRVLSRSTIMDNINHS